MDLITFRCSSCNRGLKVPAVNAGRKVKCTKCGTSLIVPATSQAGTSAADPFAKKRFVEDEEGPAVYGFGEAAHAPQEASAQRKGPPGAEGKKRDGAEDDEDELDAEEREEADEALRRRLSGEDLEDDEDEDYDDEDDEDRPKKKRGPRAKLDKNAFQKARVGILLVLVAISFLAGSFLLHRIFILIGLTAGQHYAESVKLVHPHYETDPDDTKSVDMMRLLITLVGGIKAYDANKMLLIISQVFVLLQGIVTIAGCAFCLSVPRRFGARGLALTGLVVAGVNLIVALVFKFLPVVGAMKLVLVPFFGGELAMSSANIERLTPIHILWSNSPYVQVLLTVIMLVLTYGELFFFPLFLKAIALQLKAENLENSCNSLVQLGLAQVFMQVAYQLMAMTGSSDVLSAVLKVLYILSLCFFVWQLTWYILILVRSRTIIQDALDKE